MKASKRADESGAAFVMEAGDRFHCILVSDGVRYQVDDDAETILTFFVIRRRTGLYDIVNVNKTFKGKKCVSRTVQAKERIDAGRIDAEAADIERAFAKGIEDKTGYRITWHRLDLSGVLRHSDQVAAIKAWGRVGVRLAADIPPIGLN
jgi:hypothetical protein